MVDHTALLLMCFLSVIWSLGNPSCHVDAGNGPGIIRITTPAINESIVKSSQLKGACLTNDSASYTDIRFICTPPQAVVSSADCISDHDPPNPWCQDNVISLNFTSLLNGSGIFSTTLQASGCTDIILGLSLQGSGIFSFDVKLCQFDCTQLAKPENVQLTVNDSNVFEGDVISLSCSADGNPAVHTYQLFENDTLVSDSSSPLVWSKSASTAGVFVYRCEANNAVGTANSTTTVIVNAMGSTLQSPTMLRKSVSDESSESQNLSGGLIAVIVIAVVVAIIAVVLLFYCCYRFRGKFKRYYQQRLNLLPFTRSQEQHNNRNNDLEPRNEITPV